MRGDVSLRSSTCTEGKNLLPGSYRHAAPLTGAYRFSKKWVMATKVFGSDTWIPDKMLIC